MAHHGGHRSNNTNFKAAVIRTINTKMRLHMKGCGSTELQPLITIVIIRVSILCFYRPLAGCQTGWIQCRFHNGASGICGRCGVSVNSSSALQADGVGYLRWNESAWMKQSKPEGCSGSQVETLLGSVDLWTFTPARTDHSDWSSRRRILKERFTDSLNKIQWKQAEKCLLLTSRVCETKSGSYSWKKNYSTPTAY